MLYSKHGDIIDLGVASMELIIAIVTLWLIVKGLRSLSGVRRTTSRKAKTAQAVTKTNSLAALTALQAQRDTINEQLADIETQLDYAPPAKIRNQLMNRKTVLLGKLSTCEQRIARMCA